MVSKNFQFHTIISEWHITIAILGSFLLIYLQDGDFNLYRLKDKALFTVKGVHRPELKREEKPHIYVNDHGSIIVVR